MPYSVATNTPHALTAAVQGVRRELLASLKLAIPAALDILATFLMNVGLLSCTASINQMLRGSEILFTALLGVAVLRRRLNALHLTGVMSCVVGIFVVGVASVLSGSGGTQVSVSKLQILFGMVLIVASQAVQASQITLEDHMLTTLSDITPLKVRLGHAACLLQLFLMPTLGLSNESLIAPLSLRCPATCLVP